MTNSTVQIALKNNTKSSNAHAYITGLDINRNNVPLLMQSDGTTPYYPSSPSSPLQALGADCAISLGSPGSTRTITIPQIAGGRIWFALDGTLTFLVNPGPAIVEPSVTNPADPNYNQFWGFCEFTFNQAQLFVNISYVDFVSLPIALELRNESDDVQKVQGLAQGGLDTVCTKLVAQNAADGAGWDKLVVKSPSGANLRALSPNSGIVMNNALFQGYYQPYVDAVWSKYANETLTVNTQAQWGDKTAKVVNGKLTFDDGAGSYAQPSAADVFSCSTGPFGGYPAGDAGALMGALGARIAAAFNRSTLLVNPNQPNDEQVANYYKETITNHYSRVCHDTNADGRGYAFPYDDVGPSDGGDQSGSVFDGAPKLLTVTLSGVGVYQASGDAPTAAIPEGLGGEQKVVKGMEDGEKKPKEDDGAKPSLQRKKKSLCSTIKGVSSRFMKRFGAAK
ncbi:glucanase B [Pseudomassariella vexata]|uniref:Glucanase B n=1 Tax=Pseudomassariella vexata TaxID=1141098 RepID=A0A1Y2EDN6_9PEZI|nr:glucanase B [Pseudomassariella vexata]ORY69681.1 glucanase B [Pseudomassariella vexata]